MCREFRGGYGFHGMCCITRFKTRVGGRNSNVIESVSSKCFQTDVFVSKLEAPLYETVLLTLTLFAQMFVGEGSFSTKDYLPPVFGVPTRLCDFSQVVFLLFI